MATNFPGSLDSFTNPSSSSTLDSPSHAAQHANINDAMEAVQAKLGVGAGTIGEWQTYTPSIEASTTNPTANTSGLYYELNEIVFARILINNFTAAGSGTYYITTPTDILADLFPIAYGIAKYGAIYYPFTGLKSGTGARRVFMVLSHNQSFVNQGNPGSPGVSDTISATVIYRQA